MTKQTYWELLKRPEWQKRRLEKLSANDFTCEGCYDKESSLHVHHKRYVKGRKPWEYLDFELAVLCDSCHEFAHETIDKTNEMFAYLNYDGPSNNVSALSLIAGFFEEDFPEELVKRDCDLTFFPEYGLGMLIAVISRELDGFKQKDLIQGKMSKEDIFKVTAAIIANFSNQEDLKNLIDWHITGKNYE